MYVCTYTCMIYMYVCAYLYVYMMFILFLIYIANYFHFSIVNKPVHYIYNTVNSSVQYSFHHLLHNPLACAIHRSKMKRCWTASERDLHVLSHVCDKIEHRIASLSKENRAKRMIVTVLEIRLGI